MHWSPYYTPQTGLKIRWLAGLSGREPREEPDFGPSWGLLFERNTVISTAVHGRVFHRFFLLWVSKGYEALDGYIYELYKAYKSRPIEGFTGTVRTFMYSAAILAQV